MVLGFRVSVSVRLRSKRKYRITWNDGTSGATRIKYYDVFERFDNRVHEVLGEHLRVRAENRETKKQFVGETIAEWNAEKEKLR